MADDVKARLAAVKAEHAKLASARAVAEAHAADARELARLEQELLDNKAIVQAECELGEQGVYCACINTPRGVIILKRAPFPLFRKFQDTINPKVEKLEELVQACRFYPDADTFGDIQEEFPGLVTVCVTHICKLAGSLAEDAAKK